ncbi:MAG TPA: PDZ domain-containing protein [Vicinamibacterales bacterium]|nr:PDZ domain-containing protein [Vicinamibacterales bacterium]
MIVSNWVTLAGALLLAAPEAAPARVVAQDREPIARAFELARSAHIGVTVTDIEGEDAKQPKSGVVVETVSPGGPGDKAGIQAADTITEFDGERVRSVRQFSRLVQETSPGHSVAVTLSRGGQRVNLNVTPERRTWSDDFNLRLLDLPRGARIPTPPSPPAAPRAPLPPALVDPDFRFDFPGVMRYGNGRRLGITIESIDDQLAEYFGVKEGVLIKSVLDDSAAQKAGLKAGDVITSINGSKVYDTSDVNRAINRLETDGAFTIDVVRDKKTMSLKGKLEAADTRPRARTRTVL